LLVPVARAIVERSLSSHEIAPPLEHAEMTAGLIADLAHAQQEEKIVGAGYYEPLRPHDLPITAKAPYIEPGRVDIRFMSLMDSLDKIT